MPPHTLTQRVVRLISDCASDDTLDVRARWRKIVDDGVGAEAEAALGPMPDASLDDIDLDTAIQYAAKDADATLRLYPVLSSKLDEMGLRRALEIDENVVPMIVAMQQNGMLVDREHLALLDFAFADALGDLEHCCRQLAGYDFSVTSPDQVAEVLYSHLGLSYGRKIRSRKRLSTDEKALQALKRQHPIVSLILEHRELSKLQSSYVKKLPKLLSPDGRFRYELGLTTIPSGRLNGWGGVNPLAIPVQSDLGKEIRRAFIAPPGCVLGNWDEDQIEMRMMAHISQDERMIEAFVSGTDIHSQTASLMFKEPIEKVTPEQRHHGKQVGFGIINGITAFGLLDQMILRGASDWDEPACQGLIDTYMGVYPGVAAMFDRTWEEGRRNGYIRDELSGRILWTPGLRSPIEKVRSEAERVATNFKVQAGAQTVMKVAMAAMWDWLKDEPRIKPLLQIHDSLLFEMPEEVALDPNVAMMIDYCMTQTTKLSVPLGTKSKIGRNWGDL